MFDFLLTMRHERLPQREIFRVAVMEFGRFLATRLLNGVIPGVVVLVAAKVTAYQEIKPRNSATGSFVKAASSRWCLYPVNQDTKPCAPIAQMIIADNSMTKKRQNLFDGRSDNRATQMANVQWFGDVGAAVVDDNHVAATPPGSTPKRSSWAISFNCGGEPGQVQP
jgi:hypothetical protein